MKRILFAAATILLSLPALAQNFPGSQPVIWTNSGLVRDLNRNQSAVEFESASNQVIKSIKVPDGTMYRDYFDGVLYILVRAQEQKNLELPCAFRLMRRDGDAWILIGEYRAKTKQIQNILPLKNGRFLVVTNRALFRSGKGYTPFGLMDLDEKKKVLSPAEGIDPGFRQPIWTDPLDEYGHGEYSYPGMGFSFSGRAISLRVPGYVVIASEDIGYYYVFDDKTGDLKRKVQLFTFMDEERLKHPETLIDLGLGIQPRPNGHLLIASRTEDAAEQAGRAFNQALPKDRVGDPAKVKAWIEETKPLRDLNLKNFPGIAWWDLDPATGAIRAEAAPQNFPDRINDAKQLWAWNWRFKGDGNLLYFNSTKAEGADAGSSQPKKWFGIIPVK